MRPQQPAAAHAATARRTTSSVLADGSSPTGPRRSPFRRRRRPNPHSAPPVPCDTTSAAPDRTTGTPPLRSPASNIPGRLATRGRSREEDTTGPPASVRSSARPARRARLRTALLPHHTRRPAGGSATPSASCSASTSSASRSRSPPAPKRSGRRTRDLPFLRYCAVADWLPTRCASDRSTPRAESTDAAASRSTGRPSTTAGVDRGHESVNDPLHYGLPEPARTYGASSTRSGALRTSVSIRISTRATMPRRTWTTPRPCVIVSPPRPSCTMSTSLNSSTAPVR